MRTKYACSVTDPRGDTFSDIFNSFEEAISFLREWGTDNVHYSIVVIQGIK